MELSLDAFSNELYFKPVDAFSNTPIKEMRFLGNSTLSNKYFAYIDKDDALWLIEYNNHFINQRMLLENAAKFHATHDNYIFQTLYIIDNDNRLWGMGDNSANQLAGADAPYYYEPIWLADNVRNVSEFIYIDTDNIVWWWGDGGDNNEDSVFPSPDWDIRFTSYSHPERPRDATWDEWYPVLIEANIARWLPDPYNDDEFILRFVSIAEHIWQWSADYPAPFIHQHDLIMENVDIWTGDHDLVLPKRGGSGFNLFRNEYKEPSFIVFD
jgi:hypothetical protein